MFPQWGQMPMDDKLKMPGIPKFPKPQFPALMSNGEPWPEVKVSYGAKPCNPREETALIFSTGERQSENIIADRTNSIRYPHGGLDSREPKYGLLMHTAHVDMVVRKLFPEENFESAKSFFLNQMIKIYASQNMYLEVGRDPFEIDFSTRFHKT